MESLYQQLKINWKACAQGYPDGAITKYFSVIMNQPRTNLLFRKTSAKILESLATYALLPFGFRFYIQLGKLRTKLHPWLEHHRDIFLSMLILNDDSRVFRHLIRTNRFIYDSVMAMLQPFMALISNEDYPGKKFLYRLGYHHVFHVLPLLLIRVESSRNRGPKLEKSRKHLQEKIMRCERVKEKLDQCKDVDFKLRAKLEMSIADFMARMNEKQKESVGSTFQIAMLIDVLIPFFGRKFFAGYGEWYAAGTSLELEHVYLKRIDTNIDEIQNDLDLESWTGGDLSRFKGDTELLKGIEYSENQHHKILLHCNSTFAKLYTEIQQAYLKIQSDLFSLIGSSTAITAEQKARYINFISNDVKAIYDAVMEKMKFIANGNFSSFGDFIVKSYMISHELIELLPSVDAVMIFIKAAFEFLIGFMKKSGIDTAALKEFYSMVMKLITDEMQKYDVGELDIKAARLIPFQESVLLFLMVLFSFSKLQYLQPFLDKNVDILLALLSASKVPELVRHKKSIKLFLNVVLKVLKPVNALFTGAWPGKSWAIIKGIDQAGNIIEKEIKKQNIERQKRIAALRKKDVVDGLHTEEKTEKKEQSENEQLLSRMEAMMFKVVKPVISFFLIGVYGSGDKGPEAMRDLEKRLIYFYRKIYNFNPAAIAKEPLVLREHLRFSIARLLGPESVGWKSIDEAKEKEILDKIRAGEKQGKIEQQLLDKNDRIRRLQLLLRRREVEFVRIEADCTAFYRSRTTVLVQNFI
eukprot:TRINITY_DN3008_c0_g1_i1.p1 TRINITY_DN3008_c0_g1~~TRINITY_DN3008_c0_g1_i1.p1  ORF type:complete len:817 (+),score=160.25 TRINITY_DN3008_c0_g1_i1:198-2453(+)